MPSFEIVKRTKVGESFRAASINGRYDLDMDIIEENFQGEIPIEGLDWKIGAIVGRSGTGKTTIAKQLFKGAYVEKFKYSKNPVIDDFPKNVTMKDIAKTLNNVGFSSPPSWLKPYHVLSNGERMRVDIAMAILIKKKLVVFDEFTSVVDRDVAKISSMAISKAIRKSNKQFVAVTCHYDILEWLQPDWVFDTNEMEFQKKTSKDQQLRLRSINATEGIGECLGNIII